MRGAGGKFLLVRKTGDKVTLPGNYYRVDLLHIPERGGREFEKTRKRFGRAKRASQG